MRIITNTLIVLKCKSYSAQVKYQSITVLIPKITWIEAVAGGAL